MRKLALFTGAFSLGIFLAQYLLPAGWMLPGAFVCLGMGCLALLLPWEQRRRGVVLGVGLALALGWNWLYIRQVQSPMTALAEQEIPVTMTLCDYAVPTDYGAKATVKLEGFTHGKAVYYGEEALLELRPGQTVSDLVYLQSADRIRDTDITTFTSKGVFLLVYQRGQPDYGPGTAESPRWWPARMGEAMRGKIADLFDGDTAAFLTAILTGDKAGLSDTVYGDMAEAGLVHILAVSGMHCGFLMTLVLLLAGKHRHRLVAGAAVPVLLFYAALTGCSPSVVRACVMLLFLVAAPLFRKNSDGPTAITAALFLILLANPFAAASVSLQLSFAAMAGILWLTPKLDAFLRNGKKQGKILRFLTASFSATMGALVFTVPLTAYYFGSLVLISPISNLVCLWAASAVFLLGLLAVLTGFLWMPLAGLIALAPGLLARYILGAAHLLARVPYHAVYFDNPYLKYWLGYVYLLFGLAYLLRPKARRKYALATVLAVGTLALTIHLGTARYDGLLHAVVLDVGQGESVVLADHGEFALVDCGSSNRWVRAGEVAANRLRSMGCRELDVLLLTHDDYDHTSGVPGLLDRLPVRMLLIPEGLADSGLVKDAAARGVKVKTITDLAALDLGEARLTVYPPVGEDGDNERGLSLLTTSGECDLLLTGDMDSATERTLLARYDLPDIEVLVVGHHGSKNSTSNDLLDALAPETAVISVGSSNRYGHPSDEAMRRLAEHGCAVYRTDLQGDVHLSLSKTPFRQSELSMKQGDHYGIREKTEQVRQ